MLLSINKFNLETLSGEVEVPKEKLKKLKEKKL